MKSFFDSLSYQLLLVFILVLFFVGHPVSKVNAQSPNCSSDPNIGVSGCTQSECSSLGAYWNGSSCEPAVLGCTNSNSTNYSSNANTNDGSCSTCNTIDRSGCSQSGCSSTDGFWDTSDVSNPYCRANTQGCTDINAVNYDSSATTNDASSCLYCEPDDPGNCQDQSSCEGVGGLWYSNTSTCGQDVPGSTTAPDPEQSQYYASSASAGYFEAFESRCVSLDESFVCDRWAFDLSEDFLKFHISSIYNSIYNAVGTLLIITLSFFLVVQILKRPIKAIFGNSKL